MERFTPRPERPLKETARAQVVGRSLVLGGSKFLIRGVTYGPFNPETGAAGFGPPARLERDLALMRQAGVNTVRTYTVPPPEVLDAAARHGLRVLVGIAWEQHVAALDDPGRARSIASRVESAVRTCAGHPAVLCYAVGNEIPASIVRWHGRRRVERFLERLTWAARKADPDGLVTYVNYPTTEYLELPFLDLHCFNVYLETDRALRAYLARLQNLVGDRPLILAELGLDSHRHGEEAQARLLRRQIQTVFAGGCAGAVVFSWTDEWYRGGQEILDWRFGLTTRERRPKPALAAVRNAFAAVPFPDDRRWPRVSIVLCTHNGSATIREALDGLARLDYPDFEVIVVDDGSSDGTAALLARGPARVIRTPNQGLSAARNVGLAAATGEIVAYIDDDAWPDPHWLRHLAATFAEGDYAGVGGPNLPPPDESLTAQCVARAPGGPVHVLLSDREAEHLPGCNMAFRADRLRAIGGFDRVFRAAGDDVDVCWRLQERGWSLGFSPGAVVWHRRRRTIGAFWRQQRGYGRAEALLERKWPERYNVAGHVAWSGRLYGGSEAATLLGRRTRIYQGTWGSAPFQTLTHSPPGLLATLLAMPESWLLLGGLVATALLGLSWPPLLLALPLALLLFGLLCWKAVRGALAAWRASGHEPANASRRHRLAVTALLHLLQPLARLTGRFEAGLSPWRRVGDGPRLLFLGRLLTVWSEQWLAPARWLTAIEAMLKRRGVVVRRGGAFDDWDLSVRTGSLVSVRVLMATEEHGGGRQLLRFRLVPRVSRPVLAVTAACAGLAAAAWLNSAVIAAVALSATAGTIVVGTLRELGASLAAAAEAVALVGAARGWVGASNGAAPEPASAPDVDLAAARSRPPARAILAASRQRAGGPVG